LIELALIREDASLIRLNLLLILQHLIELSLVGEQPRLVPQNLRLVGKHLTFTHTRSSWFALDESLAEGAIRELDAFDLGSDFRKCH
jgi:hypothetical protein